MYQEYLGTVLKFPTKRRKNKSTKRCNNSVLINKTSGSSNDIGIRMRVSLTCSKI